MGFRDAFQYRRHADIDKGYPDLLGSSKWTLKKVQKIKTANLKLIDSINLSSLNLRIDTIWLAQFYFQRYFTQNAFQANTAVVFVAACVHLACKANDTPRQFEAVIKEMYKLRYAREEVELKKINDMMVLVELKVHQLFLTLRALHLHGDRVMLVVLKASKAKTERHALTCRIIVFCTTSYSSHFLGSQCL